MPNRRNPSAPMSVQKAFELGYRPSGVIDDMKAEKADDTKQKGWIYTIAALIGGAAAWRFFKR